MTTKTTKTTIVMMIAAITIISGMNTAFAHTFSVWSSPTQQYYCTTSLNNIPHTGNVLPCGDLTPSTDRWNNISGSSLSFTKSSTYYSGVVSIFGTDLGSGVAGWMQPGPGSAPNPLTWASVSYNTNTSVTWGDVSVGDSGTGMLDYQSTATHEMGHAMGIDHNTNSGSVMYGTTYYNNVNRTPDSHDISTVQGAYP